MTCNYFKLLFIWQNWSNTCFIFNCRGNLARQGQDTSMMREPAKETRTRAQPFLEKLSKQGYQISRVYGRNAATCSLEVYFVASLWLVQCKCQVVVAVCCTSSKPSEWLRKSMRNIIAAKKSMFLTIQNFYSPLATPSCILKIIAFSILRRSTRKSGQTILTSPHKSESRL